MAFKVLVVDDDATTLEILTALLEELGHQVLVRQTPLGTTALIMREQPDIVVLDVNMPGLSGVNLLKLLKSEETSAAHRRRDFAPKIVLFSSLDKAELAALADEHGADAAVSKADGPRGFLAAFNAVARALQAAPVRNADIT